MSVTYQFVNLSLDEIYVVKLNTVFTEDYLQRIKKVIHNLSNWDKEDEIIGEPLGKMFTEFPLIELKENKIFLSHKDSIVFDFQNLNIN